MYIRCTRVCMYVYVYVYMYMYVYICMYIHTVMLGRNGRVPRDRDAEARLLEVRLGWTAWRRRPDVHV